MPMPLSHHGAQLLETHQASDGCAPSENIVAIATAKNAASTLFRLTLRPFLTETPLTSRLLDGAYLAHSAICRELLPARQVKKVSALVPANFWFEGPRAQNRVSPLRGSMSMAPRQRVVWSLPRFVAARTCGSQVGGRPGSQRPGFAPRCCEERDEFAQICHTFDGVE